MPEPTAPAPAAAPAPAQATPPEPQVPAVDPAEFARLQSEVNKLKTDNGRLRNRVGAAEMRARELELSTFQNDTGLPDSGEPTNTGYPPQYGSYPPQPQASGNFVSKDEFDEWRFDTANQGKGDLNKRVRDIAYSSQVAPFVRYQVDSFGRPVMDAYGRAIPDRFRTFEAIAQHLELEQLRKVSSVPPSNPNMAVISGSGASAVEPAINLETTSWQDMAKKGLLQADENDPPSFARGPASDRPFFPGRR